MCVYVCVSVCECVSVFLCVCKERQMTSQRMLRRAARKLLESEKERMALDRLLDDSFYFENYDKN